MPSQVIKYDKDLKNTPEFQTLYNKWLCIRKQKFLCSEAFEQFLDFYNWSMANGFVIGARLKRLDDSKSWSPDNCIFVDPAEDCRAYTEEQKAWIVKWNKTVNRIRRYFGIETFDYEGDA